MDNGDIAQMAHLMRRAGFGAPRDELEARAAKGYEATVEELLHPEEQPPLDRNEMMRYHPWAWRPGTLLAIAVGAEEDADGRHGRLGGTIVIGRSVSRARRPWRLEQLQVRESFRKRRPVWPQRILPL